MLIKSEKKDRVVCELNKHKLKIYPFFSSWKREICDSFLCHKIYLQLIYEIINYFEEMNNFK
jgi:hypothetical protein